MKKCFLVVLLFSCQIFVAQTQTNDYKITYKQFISYGDKTSQPLCIELWLQQRF